MQQPNAAPLAHGRIGSGPRSSPASLGLAVFARSQVGLGYHLGDVAALALMASATFIILINQRSMPAQAEAEASQD